MATELERDADVDAETRAADRDAQFSFDSALTETSPVNSGRHEPRAGEEEAEQLTQLHLSQQQQLYKEQLEQLKAFKAQLVEDVLTQLSPQPGNPQLGPARPIGHPVKPPEVSLSLGGAGSLLYPLSIPLPPHCSPPAVTTPVRQAVSPEEFINPLPLPLSSPSTPRLRLTPPPDISTLHTPNNPPAIQPQCIPIRQSLEEGSICSTPAPYLSPQLQGPNLSYSPTTATNPTVHTHPFQPVPLADTSRKLFQTPPTSHPIPPHLQPRGINVADVESEAGAVLIQKYAKQVEALNAQLAELRETVQADKFAGQIPSAYTYAGSPKAWRATSPSSSLPTTSRGHSPPAAPPPAPRLQADNERLRTKCADLEHKLQQSSLYVAQVFVIMTESRMLSFLCTEPDEL